MCNTETLRGFIYEALPGYSQTIACQIESLKGSTDAPIGLNPVSRVQFKERIASRQRGRGRGSRILHWRISRNPSTGCDRWRKPCIFETLSQPVLGFPLGWTPPPGAHFVRWWLVRIPTHVVWQGGGRAWWRHDAHSTHGCLRSASRGTVPKLSAPPPPSHPRITIS